MSRDQIKKKYALVLTGLLNTWYKKSTNVLINEWCLGKTITTDGFNYKKYSFFISKKSKNNNNIVKEGKTCSFYYRRLLDDIILNLKADYNIKWNKRSWEVFLGSWMHRYVSVIFDRYYSLEYALRQNDIGRLVINNDLKFNLLTKDHSDFKTRLQNDEWNLKLFTKLFLRYFNNNKIEIKKINLPSKRYYINTKFLLKINFFQKIKNNILKFLLKYLDHFTKKIYYKTYFGSKKTIFLVNLLNKNIPFIYNFKNKLPEINHISSTRNKKIRSNYKLNKFEKVLRDLFFELLPLYYLEQIENLKYCKKNLFLPNTKEKKIYTSMALHEDDVFKFWLCEALSNKSKLFNFQHGNNYGALKFLYSEYLEVKLCDKFLTWGWNGESKKIKAFFCVKLINKKKYEKIISNKVLIIGAGVQIYRQELTSGNIDNDRFLIYIKLLKKTLQLIQGQFQKNTYFRPYPLKSNMHDYRKAISDELNLIKIHNTKNNFSESLKKFGLIIHVDDGTSFLETMALNKPTVMILSNKLYFDHHRRPAAHFYKKLGKVNIIHESPDKLIQFLKKLNFNFNDWWFDKKTQTIKNEFCSKYCKKAKDPLKLLRKI